MPMLTDRVSHGDGENLIFGSSDIERTVLFAWESPAVRILSFSSCHGFSPLEFRARPAPGQTDLAPFEGRRPYSPMSSRSSLPVAKQLLRLPRATDSDGLRGAVPGSQVTQLIARRVREDKVYCEIVPFQKADEAFRAMRPKGVILSGGPASVLDRAAMLAPTAIYAAGVLILGICYGEQAMAQQLGGMA